MELTICMKGGSSDVKVTFRESDGSETERVLSISQFLEIFEKEKSSEYYGVSPLFEHYEPANKMQGLICGKKYDECVKGILFVPAGMRPMNYAGEKFIVPYPSLIFFLISNGGVLKESLCFVVKEATMEKLRMDSRLYVFPFGNVHPDTARICWGTNKFKPIKDYENLREVVEIFFSSESNSDYVNPKKNFKGCKSYNDFLMKLKGKETFPMSSLRESRYGTFSALIEKF